jgi:DNA-binding NtrC family response regulator
MRLISMDFRMPKLDGLNALQIIRRLNPALPVFMFTGQAGQGEMLEAGRLGALTSAAKPVAFEAFLSTLPSAPGAPVH